MRSSVPMSFRSCADFFFVATIWTSRARDQHCRCQLVRRNSSCCNHTYSALDLSPNEFDRHDPSVPRGLGALDDRILSLCLGLLLLWELHPGLHRASQCLSPPCSRCKEVHSRAQTPVMVYVVVVLVLLLLLLLLLCCCVVVVLLLLCGYCVVVVVVSDATMREQCLCRQTPMNCATHWRSTPDDLEEREKWPKKAENPTHHRHIPAENVPVYGAMNRI